MVKGLGLAIAAVAGTLLLSAFRAPAVAQTVVPWDGAGYEP